MIRFDKVSFTYQESLQNGGLRDVDLTINKGECVLLCGRSGCGKTTLTRLVNGLIPYFYPGEVTGTTYVDGKNIQDYPIYGSTFPFEPSKHWFHKNRVQRTLNMDCSHRATGRHLRVMYET